MERMSNDNQDFEIIESNEANNSSMAENVIDSVCPVYENGQSLPEICHKQITSTSSKERGIKMEDVDTIAINNSRGMGSLIDGDEAIEGDSAKRIRHKERPNRENGRSLQQKHQQQIKATSSRDAVRKMEDLDTIMLNDGRGMINSSTRMHHKESMETARRDEVTNVEDFDTIMKDRLTYDTGKAEISDNEITDSGLCFCCPVLDPIPLRDFVCLTIAAAIPAVLYIIAFTKIGYGLQVFSFIDTKLNPFAPYVGGVVLVYATILYFLDCYHWGSHNGMILRRNLMLLLAAGILAFIVCISSAHPYGPVGIILVATTSWMVAIRFLFFRDIERKIYISRLSGPILFVSAFVALYWFIWTFVKEENEWTIVNSLLDAEEAGCDPDFVNFPQCDDGDGNACFTVNDQNLSIDFRNCDTICTQLYDSCPNTFIIWAGPFLVSVGFFFLSFFASFLRGDGSTEESVGKLAKIWMFLLFGIWVSSSLAGAGAGVSATLAALTLAAFIASAIFLVAGYDTFERDEHAISMWQNIKEKYGSFMDYGRGLLIITCTPVALLYLLVSVLKQWIRSCNSCSQKPATDTESLSGVAGVGWVTVEARRLLKIFGKWDRAKVFTYAIYWGIGFMVLSVIVSEFTIVFLSWLIEETQELSIAAVTGILAGAGMIMFLLPPVPGVPIYLTLGIVIVPVGREMLGIFGSILYAMVVSLILKLMACTIQQKMIGGLLRHKISVRQFVGMNTNLIRSMKLVLKEKGLGVAKVAILIGGPDWPTSVLCGIMDLPLIPILVGTLPIVLLILPTLLTGSFTYMANLKVDGQLEFPWATTLATVSAALTALVQFGSMIVAAFYLETVIATRGKDIESIPIDIEVKEADDKLDKLNKAYDEVTVWHRVPTAAKIVLYVSLVCMILCCYLVQLFADLCFVDYQLTFTIDEHLNGSWKNIVLPLGAAALILFFISVVLLLVFITWAKRRAQKQSFSVPSDP